VEPDIPQNVLLPQKPSAPVPGAADAATAAAVAMPHKIKKTDIGAAVLLTAITGGMAVGLAMDGSSKMREIFLACLLGPPGWVLPACITVSMSVQRGVGWDVLWGCFQAWANDATSACHAPIRYAIAVLPCLARCNDVVLAIPRHCTALRSADLILCQAVPCMCHAMPCHAMPCHAMPCHAMPCHAMPCSAVQVPASLAPLTVQLQATRQMVMVPSRYFCCQHAGHRSLSGNGGRWCMCVWMKKGGGRGKGAAWGQH
jgi:hypothetical protein